MNVKEQVYDLVSDQLGVDRDKITDETHFVNDLGADSLDMVELVMELEEEFDIQIPDSALDDTHTIGDALKKLEAHLSPAST